MTAAPDNQHAIPTRVPPPRGQTTRPSASTSNVAPVRYYSKSMRDNVASTRAATTRRRTRCCFKQPTRSDSIYDEYGLVPPGPMRRNLNRAKAAVVNWQAFQTRDLLGAAEHARKLLGVDGDACRESRWDTAERVLRELIRPSSDSRARPRLFKWAASGFGLMESIEPGWSRHRVFPAPPPLYTAGQPIPKNTEEAALITFNG